jgi:hypothetical protein
MHGFRLIGRLLAIFAVAGLLASPAVTSAIAKPLPGLDMGDMSASADMPCCPDTQKSNNCQDCPLHAMCTLSIAQLAPSLANRIHEPLPTRRSFLVFDDLIADGLDGRPPDHPPRILV